MCCVCACLPARVWACVCTRACVCVSVCVCKRWQMNSKLRNTCRLFCSGRNELQKSKSGYCCCCKFHVGNLGKMSLKYCVETVTEQHSQVRCIIYTEIRMFPLSKIRLAYNKILIKQLHPFCNSDYWSMISSRHTLLSFCPHPVFCSYDCRVVCNII